ncbi:MAG: hypothetical protein ACO3LZ_08895 [Candidatus Nanopelagicales bacterium]
MSTERIDQSLQGSTGDMLVTADLTPDGTMIVRHEQDLEPHVEYAKKLANSDEYTRQGIKKGFAHAAHIPDVVVVELKQIGIDVFRASAREIITGLKRLNKEHLLTSRKRLWRG